ncbi:MULTISPECIES: prolipoprotein diacylglyceryl transferase [Fusobacterium]|uniref:prolipoprotein diacylglyceryl transferase n=1 Tax=Fusobacterium TaxID=848 RepID=UPI0014778353|nr:MULTISPECIES: prolipoprotein diacylglyceryl transferase [Fusobacterium]NME35493.1 prolipoprotein diacylglyceryl transferase [Fusobacterium sp. FSA-380-WT-3A]
MNPIFISIGKIKITYYGLMYAISFLLGIELGKRAAKEKGFNPEIIENYAFVAMISGLLGGRIYYVLFNLDYYLQYPEDIIAVWKGGMAIHGGIIGGIIGTCIYGYIKKINPLQLGDFAAGPLLLGQGIGRIGNLMNGEIYGVPTFTPLKYIFSLKPNFYQWFNQYNSLSIFEKAQFQEKVPWGLVFPLSSPAGQEFPNLPLHPAMLYELVLNFLGFIFIWFFLRKKEYPVGVVWCSYIIIYSVIRIFVSFFRAEDLMLLGFRAPHVVSLIMIIIASIFIGFLKKNNQSLKK